MRVAIMNMSSGATDICKNKIGNALDSVGRIC